MTATLPPQTTTPTPTARGRLADALLPHAEELVAEYAGVLPADAVVRCIEAAMSGALLFRLDVADAVAATMATAREDCRALVEASEEAAAERTLAS